MSNRYPIDDLFRDRFQNYEPDLPGNAWEQVQAARKKRKRRPLFWWISASIVLLTLIGWMSWPSVRSISKQGETALLEAPPLVDSSTQTTANKNESPATEKENNPQVFSIPEPGTGTEKNPTTPPNTINVKSESEAFKRLPPPVASSSNIRSKPSNERLSLPEKSTSTSRQSNTASYPIKPSVTSNEDQLVSGFSSRSKKHNQKTTRHPHNEAQSTLSIQVSRKNEPSINDNTSTLSGVDSEANTAYTTSQKRNNMRLAAPYERVGQQFSTVVKSNQYPPCPNLEREAAANKTYIEWYGGPDLGIKSYQDTGSSTFLQKRRESTDFRWAFSAGFRYTRVFQNGVSFRTGINFTQITERFRWVKANYVQVNYTIDPTTGDTTGTTSNRGTRYKTTFNRFRSIDVPILLGYETGFGKLKLNAYAGGMLNVYSWQRGEVLDTSLRPVSITTGKTESPYQYRNNMGLALTGGMSLYYRIHENWQLLAEPYFRYPLTPMNKDGLTLRERYSLLGLRIGIRRDLW